MKMTSFSFILVVFLALHFSPAGMGATIAGPTARAVMERVDERDDGDRSVSDMEMILIDRHGKTRTRILRSFGLDRGEDTLNLIFFLSPADVADTGFLTYDYDAPGRDDDQWLFLPALNKTKRIAASDKSGSFMGSDFSYADLTKDRLEDYRYSFYEKKPEETVYGHITWVIESIPQRPEVIEETGYTRSILFVRQDNFVVVRALHFCEDRGKVKYYDVKKMEPVGTIWTPLEIHMTTRKGGRTDHKTILTFTNVRYNQESVDEDLFTLRRLEKGP